MPRLRSRPWRALLVLAAVLLSAPALHARDFRPPLPVPAVTNPLAPLWDALLHLWQKAGSGLDPSGSPGYTEEGSGLDPNGGRNTIEEGGGLDPSGRM